ncbi:MAG: YihY/virulence factor BrkB family protein [Dehalococcoidia bacterium]
MRLDPHYWRHWWALHLHWWWGDVRLLFRRTFSEFGDDHCTQLAASISYYVLFSIFPLAILFVSVSGLILTDNSIRDDVVDQLFDALPLSEDEGRADLESAIDGVATGFSAVGLISLLGLLWSASGMMGALRQALNQAWDTDFRRPFLRGKLVDFVMVLGMGTLLTLSIGSTIFLQVARRVSDDLSDFLGPLGAGATVSFEVVAVLVPLVFSFATFMFVFKFVPSVKTRFAHVWPGALLAALLFEVVKNGFAIYLRNFGNYDAVYGSLGAVIAFLFFVYVSANILLLGAEMAAEWPRVIHGHYDKTLERAGQGPAPPLRRRAKTALGRLVRHEEEAPEHIADTSAGERRRQRKAEEIARRLADRSPPPGEQTPPSPETQPGPAPSPPHSPAPESPPTESAPAGPQAPPPQPQGPPPPDQPA